MKGTQDVGSFSACGLSDAQKAKRDGKLTGSRIACLMTGDAAKIHQLWLEMTGQAAEPDLSDTTETAPC